MQAASSWYENRLAGLGERFAVELNRAMGDLETDADRFPIYYLNFRRALLRRFPYKIFYQIEGDRVIVFRVLHASRDHRATAL